MRTVLNYAKLIALESELQSSTPGVRDPLLSPGVAGMEPARKTCRLTCLYKPGGFFVFRKP